MFIRTHSENLQDAPALVSLVGLWDMSQIERAASVISQAAEGMFQQHKYSNGYLSFGDSEIAEANIVIHVASSFIQAGSHVWAESPFKTHESNQCKHLDLLVDLAPESPDTTTLLTIEAKRIGFGEGDIKVEEILKDYERIRSWRSLAPEQIPLFYGVTHPVEWFYGCLLVVFPEQCDKFGHAVTDLFSSWWKDRTTCPSGFSESGISRLEDVLNASVFCNSCLAKTWDGGRRLAVAYALFDFGPGPGSYETAAHEAAHAVVAWRLDIPVRAITLTVDGELRGGAVCDWESLRDSQSDREACIRGFAVAYAGAIHQIMNDKEELSFSEMFDTLPTDAKVVEEIRYKLIVWGHLAAGSRTDEESSEGYKRANQILLEEQDRIDRLAEHLLVVPHMDEPSIAEWFALDAGA